MAAPASQASQASRPGIYDVIRQYLRYATYHTLLTYTYTYILTPNYLCCTSLGRAGVRDGGGVGQGRAGQGRAGQGGGLAVVDWLTG